ncbi:MAG: tRNA(fMet)-specific endonuclease VapC [Candidatus Thorarchaeota archaeon]|nr:MAG: tRNA(fMet)-specific endonuclease VapC [Candidatus Thorarchaeota archaeon]
MYTSEVNAFELYSGLYGMPIQQDSKIRKRQLELEQILAQTEVLPFTRLAAIEAGRVLASLKKRGHPIGIRDVMIAGVAISSGVTRILTNNQRHFEKIDGLIVESY